MTISITDFISVIEIVSKKSPGFIFEWLDLLENPTEISYRKAMKSLKSVKFEIRNHVAVISLSRPNEANGVNFCLANELALVAKECDNNSTIRAVILTGTGRFFCAGGDIKEMASDGDKRGMKIKDLADHLHIAISTFARMKAPVIIAVNGMAAGAGFSLAMCGDIVLASEKAAFLMAYTKAGLSPDGGASYYLPRLIGLRRTQELMLTNRQLSAAEAHDWGLINEVVKADKLLDRAISIANGLASGSVGANAAVKKLLLCSFGNTLETQMEIEGREISERANSEDGKEGISAFVEKRNPDFT